MVFDRIEGKPDQAIDITTGGETLTSVKDAEIQKVADLVAEDLKKKKTNATAE